MRTRTHTLVLLLVAGALAATFVGDTTPTTDIAETMGSINFASTAADIISAQAEVPGPLNFLKSVQGGGGNFGQALLAALPNKAAMIKAGLSLAKNLIGKIGNSLGGGSKGSSGSSGATVKVDPNTAAVYTTLPDSKTATFNPSTGTTTTVDPVAKTMVIEDPTTNTVTAIDETTGTTTTIDKAANKTTLHDFINGVIEVVDAVAGTKTTYETATNKTTVATVNSTTGSVVGPTITTITEEDKVIIEDKEKGKTIVIDMNEMTCVTTFADGTMKKETVTTELLKSLGVTAPPPVPASPVSVEEAKIALLPAEEQKAARENLEHGIPLAKDPFSIVTDDTIPALTDENLEVFSEGIQKALEAAEHTEVKAALASSTNTMASGIRAAKSANSAAKSANGAAKSASSASSVSNGFKYAKLGAKNVQETKTDVDKIFDSLPRSDSSTASSASSKLSKSSSKLSSKASALKNKVTGTVVGEVGKGKNKITAVTSDAISTGKVVLEKAGKQTEVDQKLVEKYVAKEKAVKKAAAVKQSNVQVVNTQCAKGSCCNVETGSYMPAGTPCYSSPCAAPTICLGLSSQCPPSTTFVEDGTVCPGGACMTGVCVAGSKPTNNNVNNSDKPVSVNGSTTSSPTKLSKEKKTRDSLSKPAVTPSEDGSGNRKFWQFDHKIKCTTGGCCNLNTGFVKIVGSECTESKHECYEAAIDSCNGYEYKCPRKAKEDGTKCSIGQCSNGVCTSSATSSSVSLTSSAAAAKKTVEDEIAADGDSIVSDFIDDNNAARVEELDVNLRKLEDKIAEVRQQQNKIDSRAKENKRLAAENMLRNAVDNLYASTKREHDLARRALYPHQITTSRQDANDHAGNDFNLHSYITQLMTEKNKYRTESLRNATSQLQSANAANTFPWQLIVVAAIAVVAIAVVVAIVKVGKSGSSSKSKKNDDYETF